MLEKKLFEELHKRIKHRFKLSGRPYNNMEAGKYFKMILKEVVDKILDELIDPVDKMQGWWCGQCHEFIPVEGVVKDQESCYHYDCGGNCHRHDIKGGN